jgi:hypothetical protein
LPARRIFEVIRLQYPRLDDGRAALAAYEAAMADADDPAQLRCCLLDSVVECRASVDKLPPLAEFIADGTRWRPEYLELKYAA